MLKCARQRQQATVAKSNSVHSTAKVIWNVYECRRNYCSHSRTRFFVAGTDKRIYEALYFLSLIAASADIVAAASVVALWTISSTHATFSTSSSYIFISYSIRSPLILKANVGRWNALDAILIIYESKLATIPEVLSQTYAHNCINKTMSKKTNGDFDCQIRKYIIN